MNSNHPRAEATYTNQYQQASNDYPQSTNDAYNDSYQTPNDYQTPTNFQPSTEQQTTNYQRGTDYREYPVYPTYVEPRVHHPYHHVRSSTLPSTMGSTIAEAHPALAPSTQPIPFTTPWDAEAGTRHPPFTYTPEVYNTVESHQSWEYEMFHQPPVNPLGLVIAPAHRSLSMTPRSDVYSPAVNNTLSSTYTHSPEFQSPPIPMGYQVIPPFTETSSLMSNEELLSSIVGPPRSKPREKAEKDPRPHRCKVCNKGFPRPSALRTHMSVHSGDRPYKCPVVSCDKEFAVRSNARRHLKTHGLKLKPTDRSGRWRSRAGNTSTGTAPGPEVEQEAESEEEDNADMELAADTVAVVQPIEGSSSTFAPISVLGIDNFASALGMLEFVPHAAKVNEVNRGRSRKPVQQATVLRKTRELAGKNRRERGVGSSSRLTTEQVDSPVAEDGETMTISNRHEQWKIPLLDQDALSMLIAPPTVWDGFQQKQQEESEPKDENEEEDSGFDVVPSPTPAVHDFSTNAVHGPLRNAPSSSTFLTSSMRSSFQETTREEVGTLSPRTPHLIGGGGDELVVVDEGHHHSFRIEQPGTHVPESIMQFSRVMDKSFFEIPFPPVHSTLPTFPGGRYEERTPFPEHPYHPVSWTEFSRLPGHNPMMATC